MAGLRCGVTRGGLCGARRDGGANFKDMRSIVQNLQAGYRDQLTKLNLHAEIATKLNTRIAEEKLSAIGNLEQDLVFGDASSKELIGLVNSNPVSPPRRWRAGTSAGAHSPLRTPSRRLCHVLPHAVPCFPMVPGPGSPD